MNRNHVNAYLVGSGIASLASAAYLIKEGGLSASNIHIFEAMRAVGGAMDTGRMPEKGYVIRGRRMFNFSYLCTYELLSFIPSLTNSAKTVRDELIAFNASVKTLAKARLIVNGEKVDVSSMGFGVKDRRDLFEIISRSERSLDARRIDECFQPSFFETNFWYMWATMFGFQLWHSAVEFKRYIHRFMHEFPRVNSLAGFDRTPYNQYDSIILPIETWLKSQGVEFKTNAQVTDLDFKPSASVTTVERLHYVENGETKDVSIRASDLVFVTNGSMTAASSFGSHSSPPVLNASKPAEWALWKKLARKRPDFGRPWMFDGHIDESWGESFTVTCRDLSLLHRIEDFTGNPAGTGGLVTFKDSNWLLSMIVPYQPHFINQPADTAVFSAYGLIPQKLGNFVQKRMFDCGGAEFLVEFCSHLGFTAELPQIVASATCIPCMMPYMTSQFLIRQEGDRPHVVPEGSTNLAFIGQYCEIKDDVVFTVEYSVRSAQMAVYKLLRIDKEPPALYQGQRDLPVFIDAIETMFS
jgi:oleate hydratase